MYVATGFTSTAMSGTVYHVTDIFTRRVIFTTRRPDVAVTVAARCNTGDTRVFSTDFTS